MTINVTRALFIRCAYGIITGSLALGSMGAAHSQDLPSQMDDATFILRVPGRTPPVKVTRVLLDGNAIPMDHPIPVSGNWISHLTVEMQNISAKDIVFGELMVTYPETGTGVPGGNSPIMTSLSDAGWEPAVHFRLKDGTMHQIPAGVFRLPQIRIQPGGSLHFDFAADDDSLAAAYKLNAHLHTVVLTPRTFYFADQTKWSSGMYLTPVPAPVLWREMPAQEFFSKASSSSSSGALHKTQQ